MTATFARQRTRHRFTARDIQVSAIERLVGPFIRVTFTGPELHDFVSSGPADHSRLFFPDPETGELIAPSPAGPDEDGIVRPEATMFPRDFTPLNVRDDQASGMRAFDVDFLQHADAGPASAWASTAQVGDHLVVVGPRGSAGAPQDAQRLLCIVDPSALPAAGRWLTEVPASTEVEVIADVAEGDLTWVQSYLDGHSGGRPFTLRGVNGTLADAAAASGVDAGTFVFAAGEAGRLIALRRLLKNEYGTPRTQMALSGYWKSGLANFDHHAPIDAEDPDDA